MNQQRLKSPKPLVFGALLAPVLVVCLFLLILLPAVRHISKHTDNLTLAVVNQSGEAGSSLQARIKKEIPFTVRTNLSKAEALSRLNQGNVQMVLVIPQNFVSNLSEGKAMLNFTLSGTDSSETQSIMKLAEQKITAGVNAAAFNQMKKGLVQGITKQIQQMPQSSKISLPPILQKQMIQGVHSALANLPTQPVQAKETILNNNADNPVPALLPFLNIITYFIGAMASSVLSYIFYRYLRFRHYNLYSAAFIQVGINLGASMLVALADLLLFAAFGATPVSSSWTAWWSLGLGYFSMSVLIQMFLYLIGFPGLAVGLLLFPLQLITAGFLLPVQFLPVFYRTLSTWLPASHISGISLSSFLGGGVFAQDAASLAVISVVCLAVIFLRISIPFKTPPQEQSAA